MTALDAWAPAGLLGGAWRIGAWRARDAVVAGALVFVAASRLLGRWPALLHGARALHPTLAAAEDGNADGGDRAAAESKGAPVHREQRRGAAPGNRLARVRTIAHRGGREERPENTVASFRHALELGCDLVELDVRLTKDRRVVIAHDNDFRRMCADGSGRPVEDFAYAELPRVRLPTPDEHRQGYVASRSLQDTPDGLEEPHGGDDDWCRVPLLDEVLDLVTAPDAPPCCLIVEFKQAAGHPSLAPLIDMVHAKLGARRLRRGRAFWFSLKEPVQRLLHAKDPSIATITSVPRMLTLLLWHHTGVLPFLPHPYEAAYGFPLDRVDFHRARHNSALRAWPDWVLRLLVPLFNLFLFAPGLCTHLRARGMHVMALGVNDEPTLADACRLGCTAVLTDRPRWLLSLLKAGKHQLQSLCAGEGAEGC